MCKPGKGAVFFGWVKLGENYGGVVLPGPAGRGASTVRTLRIISNAVVGKVL